jgi:hypothetical protein
MTKQHTPENILGISQKENQRRQNYQRAEAFLRWKFGSNYYHIEDSIRGSGENWPSLFVEFVERVEADLLSRMQYIEQLHLDTVMLKDVTIKGFFEWASGILTSLKPDSKPNEFKGYCSEFFVKNRTLLEAYPELPTRQEKHGDQTYTVHASVREREIAHWNNVIEFSQRTWEPTMRIKNEFNTEVVE